MPTPFASLETRVNDSVLRRLANKTLTIDHVDVDGIFKDPFEEVGFVESSNPTFETLESNLDCIEQGSMAEEMSTGKQWEIIGIEKDGTGIVKLELRVKWYE
ncbi:hypothetical protein [uncultured Paraglaciecola sp.]|uniref:head-tail joining protein n=1 Tax=uncultured Paraglaciecola sp. TaxID=1765024 RepID=UPI00262799BE|nr:hypothetical protein [uncultured Paraglaciecola sp.]